MGRASRLFAAAVALALLTLRGGAALAADAPNKCKLGQMAEFPVTMRGARALVTAQVNGQPLQFFLDSGAFFSGMTPAAAAKLGLSPEAVPNMRVEGLTGGANARTVRARTFGWGDYQPHGMEFILLGGGGSGSDIAGMIGQNILGAADVEYDLPHGVIRLFDARDCGKQPLAYWGGSFSSIDIDPISPTTHIRGTVEVNGRKMHALFDTGMPTTAIAQGAAARVGVTVSGAGVRYNGSFSGAFGGRVESWVAPFDSVAFGEETVRRVRLQVARLSGLFGDDMLVGIDFFLSHRVYVAKSQSRLYFTYVGGPVFRFDEVGPTSAAAAATEALAADAPLADADAYSRRAAAAVARRDLAHAVEDYGHAAELEPQNPKHFHDRAMARLAMGQAVLAMSDLDQAIKLKPDDWEVLFARGRLFLAARDDKRAQEDFEAAVRAGPAEPSVELAVAQAYDAAGRYETSIARYTRWIDAHPKASGLAGVLNNRCWDRALLGRELDAALADCDAALRLQKNVGFLDSRGMVKVRLGHYDEAIVDYDAALKVQPKLVWSLYGRGLAKLKKGQAAEGQADLDAAKALNPKIMDQAKAMGLAP